MCGPRLGAGPENGHKWDSQWSVNEVFPSCPANLPGVNSSGQRPPRLLVTSLPCQYLPCLQDGTELVSWVGLNFSLWKKDGIQLVHKSLYITEIFSEVENVFSPKKKEKLLGSLPRYHVLVNKREPSARWRIFPLEPPFLSIFCKLLEEPACTFSNQRRHKVPGTEACAITLLLVYCGTANF